MTESHAPVAGWYDDPELALRLRWWDGARWTNHSRPKPVVEHPAEQAVSEPSFVAASAAASTGTGSTVIAEPLADEPYGYSAPYSWSPGSAPGSPATGTMASAPAATPGSAPQPLGTYGARAHRPDELWNTRGSSIDYAPERTTTPAAWALAATPIVMLLAQISANIMSGFESTPWVWVIGAAALPVLWMIIWVRRDRITLHQWGHLRRAHWGWAFLGPLGYLAARAVVVHRQARWRGFAPLLATLAVLAVVIGVGLFSPLTDVLRDAII